MRNNNSSRFGKYLKLHFRTHRGSKTAPGASASNDLNIDPLTVSQPVWRLAGAVTECFLLEKSRLVRVDKGERNFHVFYQHCESGMNGTAGDGIGSGCGDAEAEGSPRALHYRMLSQGGVIVASDDMDDSHEHALTLEALATIGIQPSKIEAMYLVLDTLMLLGNMKFTEVDKPDAEVGAGARSFVEYVTVSHPINTQEAAIAGTTRKPIHRTIKFENTA